MHIIKSFEIKKHVDFILSVFSDKWNILFNIKTGLIFFDIIEFFFLAFFLIILLIFKKDNSLKFVKNSFISVTFVVFHLECLGETIKIYNRKTYGTYS